MHNKHDIIILPYDIIGIWIEFIKLTLKHREQANFLNYFYICNTFVFDNKLKKFF